MECFIHIGTEKTGSTAIQNFLYDNFSKFKRNNIFLSKALGHENNLGLPYIVSSRTNENNILEFEDGDLDKRKLTTDKIEKLFKKELKKNTLEKAIFTSEHLHSYLKSEESKQYLLSYLSKNGFTKFKIILFLRPALELRVSRVSTALKLGGLKNSKLPSLNENLDTLPNLYQSKKTFLSWAKVFGGENIILKKYDKDFDVIDNFMQFFDVDDDISKYKRREKSNQSLSFEHIKAFLDNEKFLQGFSNEKISRLVYESSKKFKSSNTNVFCPSEDLMKKWDEHFRDDIEHFQDFFEIDLSNLKEVRDQKINSELYSDVSNFIRS